AGGARRGRARGGRVRHHRPRVPRRGTEVGQRGPTSRPGEPEKKGYVGCSVTCPYCEHAAKFHSYQSRRGLTAHGELPVPRAGYYFGRCKQSVLPPYHLLWLARA